jgi:ribosomal protein L29
LLEIGVHALTICYRAKALSEEELSQELQEKLKELMNYFVSRFSAYHMDVLEVNSDFKEYLSKSQSLL